MLRTIWRLLLGSFALMLAIPFGTFVLGSGILADPALRAAFGKLGLAAIQAAAWSLVSDLSPEAIVAAVIAFTKALVVLLALPPTLAAVIGETFRWRSASWYAGASGLLTAALPWIARGSPRVPVDPASLPNESRLAAVLLIAGSASGHVYMAISGWNAGRRRERPQPPAHPTPPASEAVAPAAALSAPDRTGRS